MVTIMPDDAVHPLSPLTMREVVLRHLERGSTGDLATAMALAEYMYDHYLNHHAGAYDGTHQFFFWSGVRSALRALDHSSQAIARERQRARLERKYKRYTSTRGTP